MVMKNWGQGRDKFLARIIEPLKEKVLYTQAKR